MDDPSNVFCIFDGMDHPYFNTLNIIKLYILKKKKKKKKD